MNNEKFKKDMITAAYKWFWGYCEDPRSEEVAKAHRKMLSLTG
jgi:hypothetical protein